jgi:outer membrane protein insertion porin family
VGDVSGATVTFELTNRNMYGEADRLRASATFGTRTSLFRLGYFNRYIGDSDTSADFALYRSRQSFRAYRERTYGTSLELGQPISEYLNGFIRIRGERVDFSQYDDDADEDFDGYYVGAVRPMLVYDRRDNNTWATRGYLVSGGIETGYADGFLFKLLHGFEWYKTLGESEFIYYYDHTVGLMPYDADNVGISERFFVGGTSSLRGFKYREVGPRDDGDDDLATGGSTRLTQRHELRYPFNDFIRGRIFTDAAVLEEGFMDFGTPRVGSGVGVLVDFGPFVLELDFAVPVLKDSGDKTQFLHFRISSDF